MLIRDQKNNAEDNNKLLSLFSALSRLSTPSLSPADLEMFIAQILQEVKKIFNAKIAWISLVEDGRIKLKNLGISKRQNDLIGSQLLPKLSLENLKHTYPIICNDPRELYKKNRSFHTFLSAQNFHKIMGVPLKKNGKLIGALNVAGYSDSIGFTREDLKYLSRLSTIITEAINKRSKEKLESSHKFLKAIIDNLPNPIFIKDRKHRWVVLNQAISELVGYSREKMLGKSDYDFFPKEQADYFWKKDEEMFRTGEVIDIPEEPITDKRGSIHYLHTKKAPLRDSSGRITHLVGMIDDITQRKRTEEALQTERDRLELVTQHIGVGLAIISKDYRTLWANEVLKKLFGDVEGKKCYFTYNKRTGVCPDCGVREVFRTGKSEVVHEQLGKDMYGRTIWSQIIATPIKDKKGNITAVLEVVVPVTERKRVENQLRESEEKYRLLVENMKEGIYSTQKGIFTNVNESMCKMFGYSKEELVGMPAWNLAVPEIRNSVKNILFEKAAKKDFSPIEIQCLRKDGSFLISEIRLSALSEKRQFLGVVSDITDHKRAEEALRESEEKYRLLVENANEAIVVAQDGWLKFVNPKMTETMGYSKEELLSKPFVKFIHPDDQKMMLERHIKRLKGEEFPHVYPFKIIDKDGNIKWLEINAVVITWEGRPATLNFLSDITERRQMEKSLIQREQTARERARLLTELRSLYEIDDILTRVCQAVRDSELFQRAVMTLHKPEGKIINLGQVGLPQYVVERARQTPAIGQDLRSRITSKKFRISDSFFIPVEAGLDFTKSGRYIPQKIKKSVNGNWQAGDELFVPLRDFSGEIMGYLSVDSPFDGCRPDVKTIQALEMIVEAAAARVREVEAYKAVQSSETKYRTLVETAQVGIGIMDPEENLVFGNQALANLLGYQKEELLSKKLKDICDEAQYVLFKNEIDKRKKGKTSKYEAKLLSKSGKFKHVYVSSAPLQMEDGSFMGSLTVLSDLTEIKKAGEYNILLNTSRALSQTLKFDQVLKMGAEKMLETLNADRCIVLLTKDHTVDVPIKLRAYYLKAGKVSASVINLKTTKEYLSVYKRTLQARGYTPISDARTDPMPELGKKILRQARMKSSLIIPLILGKKMIAIFHVGMAKETRTFSPEEVGLIQTMANQVATALQNCRLMEDLEGNHAQILQQAELLKTQYREQKMLYELTQALSSSLYLDQLLRLATQKTTEFLNTERSSIILINPNGKTATIRAIHTQGKSSPSEFAGFTFDSDAFPMLKTQRTLLNIPDVQALAKENPLRKYHLSRGIKSTAAVPLMCRGKLLGFLTVATTKELHPYTSQEIHLLQTISNPIAMTIENLLLLEGLKFQAEQLKTQYREQKMLFELSQALSSAANLDQLIKLAPQNVSELLGTERAAIALADADGKSATLKAIYIKGKTVDPHLLGFVFNPKIFPQVADTLIQRMPFIAEDTSLFPKGSPVRRFFSSRGVKSTVVVPLVSRDKVLGFISISSMTKLHHYAPEEIRLLQTVSNTIAMSIENYALLDDLRQQYAQIENQAANLSRQTHEKDILLKVSQALAKTMGLDEISKVASKVVGSAMRADRCAVLLATPNSNYFEIKGVFSKDRPDSRKIIGKTFYFGDSPRFRDTIRTKGYLILNDVLSISNLAELREHYLSVGIKSLVGAGMFFGNKLVGILVISSTREDKTFTQEEAKLVQTMANQIAITIENARLMEVVKKHTQDLRELSSQLMKVQENERKKIARELHDEVGQMLQSMKMNLDRIKRNITSEPKKMEETKDWLMDTEQLLAQTIDDIRTLTFDLRPSMLDDFGLISTLRWYIEDFSRRSNIEIILKGKEEKYRFPLEIEVNLYRIIQEALTNVAKHAQATEVTISLSQKDSTAVLSLKDNGIGFDAKALLSYPQKGMGVFNMKERVNLLGGDFEIISQPHKGTRVNVKIPFTEVKHEESQITGR